MLGLRLFPERAEANLLQIFGSVAFLCSETHDYLPPFTTAGLFLMEGRSIFFFGGGLYPDTLTFAAPYAPGIKLAF